MISERCERQPETANTKDFRMTDKPEPKDAKKDAKEPRPIIHLGIMVVRKWVKEFGADPQQAFPGHGQMKPEQLEIDRLRREVTKLKAERDILKKAAAYFAREST